MTADDSDANALTIRIARLFDGFAPESGPYFEPERFRIGDPAERERVAAYLRGGIVLVRSTALDPDMVDRGRGHVVPASFRTDGAWIWSDGLMYYVREHGVAPVSEFYDHIVAHGYRCPAPDTEAVDRAARRLAEARR
jgi:hypothetical protein